MNINFKDIPYFSNLFLDFVDKSDILQKFLPSNYVQDNALLFNSRLSKSNKNRIIINEAIKDSFIFDYTSQQHKYYELINEKNTLFVITGQQPALFGGPLYSLYKAFSAIAHAKKLSQKYSQFNFVPIFWVEDSDDDIDEVNKYVLIDNDSEIHNMKLDNIEKSKISNFSIYNTIHSIYERIKEVNFQDHTSNILYELNAIIDNTQYISEHFAQCLNLFTSEFGLLFVKSSEVYKHKIFNDIIVDDLLHPNKLANLIESTNSKLIELGYKLQASTSEINFFYSNDLYRHRVLYNSTENSYTINNINYSPQELKDLIYSGKGEFTPKVLLRPLLQDYFFPTAMYVGGAGEIAYLSQTSSLYSHFNIDMPIIEARHSCTISNNSINRNIEKEHFSLQQLLRDFRIIENDLANELMDKELELSFDKIAREINNLYQSISEQILVIDKSLNSNIDMNINKSIDLLNNLKKKTLSQLKKKNETRFSRLIKSNHYLYPNSNLQERELNIFNIINDSNRSEFINQLLSISNKEANTHYIIEL
ncbi:MAG TPA: bacillithiol biosynthesis cysteine-adding enzyme BshC [Candidatus Kapabacteria bacterium]|nr:bacillithiol biosynthesis cysteine-adding enzyme BshC [Candidatus Kapabacteria bacterium]